MKQPAARRVATEVGRLLLCALIVFAALQAWFALRVAAMALGVDPASTTFERSEAWRLLRAPGALRWHQSWVPGAAIATSLKRAVIASEDAGFVAHHGIEWAALRHAWARNQRSESLRARARPGAPVRVVGGSTITQQLAKNLFLDGERTLWRKAQEALIVVWLETMLDKARILELYLNHVEWGQGVFGAEAAARQRYGVAAAALTPAQSARLAAMLPAPKRFERTPQSPALQRRAQALAASLDAVRVP